MQTPNPKARIGSSEVPHKISRAARKLKPTALDTDSAASSSQASRTAKDRSPKVGERKSPRSPAPEKKRPSKISELESQISQLQVELKTSKDQLHSSELSEKQAQQDAEESKKQLLVLISKLEESQQQLHLLSASEKSRLTECQEISVVASNKELSVDSAALAHAINEIQWLKDQLEMVAASEATQTKYAESVNAELLSLKGNLAESLSLVENMKIQLKDSRDSETQAQALVNETLLQLETAKKTVEALRSEGAKTMEAYNSVASELDQSRARVSLLEGLFSKVDAGLTNVSNVSPYPTIGHGFEKVFEEKQEINESSSMEAEPNNLKSEVSRLRLALKTAETRYHDEQGRSTVQVRNAYELMDQIKSQSTLIEPKLESELKKTKADIEDLKANLMDKETELQGIKEENEELSLKLEKKLSSQREREMERELKKLNDQVVNLKANLMDKETEFQNVLEENGVLKLEMNKRERDRAKVNEEVLVTDVEEAGSAEKEALLKLEVLMHEADKSNKRAVRVSEKLEAAQAANSEMEAELRRLKVQCDQWRKAAEAAAAMLSASSNGKFMERTGSLDSNYNLGSGKMNTPYSEDFDDDLMKKKNGNMLKKIGVLWKKPPK